MSKAMAVALMGMIIDPLGKEGISDLFQSFEEGVNMKKEVRKFTMITDDNMFRFLITTDDKYFVKAELLSTQLSSIRPQTLGFCMKNPLTEKKAGKCPTLKLFTGIAKVREGDTFNLTQGIEIAIGKSKEKMEKKWNKMLSEMQQKVTLFCHKGKYPAYDSSTHKFNMF